MKFESKYSIGDLVRYKDSWNQEERIGVIYAVKFRENETIHYDITDYKSDNFGEFGTDKEEDILEVLKSNCPIYSHE